MTAPSNVRGARVTELARRMLDPAARWDEWRCDAILALDLLDSDSLSIPDRNLIASLLILAGSVMEKRTEEPGA